MKKNPFAIGERWYCDRSVGGNPYNRPPFYFVISGKSRAGYKICLLETNGVFTDEQEYTHKHLKKYAIHVSKEPE